jgi:hypothetical protein
MQTESTLSGIAKTVRLRFTTARVYRDQLQFGGASLSTWFRRTYNMYNSIHEPSEIKKELDRSGTNLSTVGYYPVGRIKVDSAASYLSGKYQHAISAPFVLEPSKDPKLSEQQQNMVRDGIGQQLFAQLQASGLTEADAFDPVNKKWKDKSVELWVREKTDEMRVTVRERAIEVAKKAADYHHGFMEDQLIVGGWGAAAAVMMRNLVAEPYTAMAARESRAVRQTAWKGNKPVSVFVTAPTFRAIDPRNLFLAPDSTSAQDGSGVSELRQYTRESLLMMYKTENDDAIIKENILECLLELNVANTNLDWLGLNTNSSLMEPNSAFGIVHQGTFSQKELSDCGVTGIKKGEWYNASVEMFLNRVIRFEVLPLENNARTYYTAQHMRNNGTYAGDSVLTKLYDLQREINITLFMRQRNAYYASGKSTVVNGSALQKPADFSLMPFARNFANPLNQQGQTWIAQQIGTDPLFGQYNQHMREMMIEADEIAGVPSLFQGTSRGGVGRTTLGGAVLEQTNGERMMDNSIINLDTTLIEPMIEHLHIDNMLYEDIPKEYLTGDIVVQGKGIFGLKEIELKQRLLQESLPMLMQTTQAGITPPEMLEGGLRDYYKGKGVETSGWASSQSQNEFASAGLNAPQRSDARTYNPKQSMVGVP